MMIVWANNLCHMRMVEVSRAVTVSLWRAGGPEVFLRELRDSELRMDSMRSSSGVDCFRMTASFLSPAWKGFVALVPSSFHRADLSIVTIRPGWLAGTCHIVRDIFYVETFYTEELRSIVRLETSQP